MVNYLHEYKVLYSWLSRRYLIDDVVAPVGLLGKDEGLSEEAPGQHHELVHAEAVEPRPLAPQRREEPGHEGDGRVGGRRLEAVHHPGYLLGQLLLFGGGTLQPCRTLSKVSVPRMVATYVSDCPCLHIVEDL